MAYHWKALTPPFVSKSQVEKLIPSIKYPIKYRRRKLNGPDGPVGRLVKLRKLVTALFKHERIEVNLGAGLEARDYAERLIAEATQYGDCHRKTMDYADFWLEEKQLIHKLFKVLVPRYQNYTTACTKTYIAPSCIKDNMAVKRVILELKGNPYPPVVVDKIPRHNQLHNILLFEAKQDYYEQKKKDRKVEAAEVVTEETDVRNKDFAEDLVAEKLAKLDVNDTEAGDDTKKNV